MNKVASIKKEEEKTRLQHRLFYIQQLNALYNYIEFQKQRKIDKENRVKKLRRYFLKRKKKSAIQKHFQHLNFKCYGVVHLPEVQQTFLSQQGFFSKTMADIDKNTEIFCRFKL